MCNIQVMLAIFIAVVILQKSDIFQANKQIYSHVHAGFAFFYNNEVPHLCYIHVYIHLPYLSLSITLAELGHYSSV